MSDLGPVQLTERICPASPFTASRQPEIHCHHLPRNNETFPETAVNLSCHDTYQHLFDLGKRFLKLSKVGVMMLPCPSRLFLG